MGTSRLAVQTQVSFGMADGVTNTHVRKQIQRIRLSKGWTKHDLERAAGLAPDTLEDLEAGTRRINVDILRKMVEALGANITDVWPSPKSISAVEDPFAPERASNSLHFSRLAEVHSLTGAEASCMFMSNSDPGLTPSAAEMTPEPELRVLSTINLDEVERERLPLKLLQGSVMAPWVAYLHCENGRGLYLCLKNARVQFWAEGFIERCLSLWLADLPL